MVSLTSTSAGWSMANAIDAATDEAGMTPLR